MDVHCPTPITMEGLVLIHQNRMQHSSSRPPFPQRTYGMIEKRPIYESSQKRAREETSDEEESNNDSGGLVRRKGKRIMKT